jgi:heme exporter protein D
MNDSMGEHEMLFWGVIAVMFLLALVLSIIQKIETRKKREPSLRARLAQANREAEALLERARKDAKNSPSLGETKWGGL